MPKNAKASGVPQTASLKTVRKSEELEIKLGKEHNDDGVVNKIVKNLERIDHLL